MNNCKKKYELLQVQEQVNLKYKFKIVGANVKKTFSCTKN